MGIADANRQIGEIDLIEESVFNETPEEETN